LLDNRSYYREGVALRMNQSFAFEFLCENFQPKLINSYSNFKRFFHFLLCDLGLGKVGLKYQNRNQALQRFFMDYGFQNSHQNWQFRKIFSKEFTRTKVIAIWNLKFSARAGLGKKPTVFAQVFWKEPTRIDVLYGTF
jgi:hypothetical protein